MATLTTVAGGMVEPALQFDIRLDSIVSESATTYVYDTTDGHRVTLTGSFTQQMGMGNTPQGNIDQVQIDHSNDGMIDLQVDYVTSINPGAQNWTNNNVIWNLLLHPVTTANLSAPVLPTSLTNTFNINGSDFSFAALTSNSVTATVNASGRFSFDKSHVAGNGWVGGNDIVTIASLIGDLHLVGDLAYIGNTILPGDIVRGGDDQFTDQSVFMPGFDLTIIGDMNAFTVTVSGVTFVGGDDTITGNKTPLTAVGDVGHIGAASTTVQGGDDNITGSSVGDLLIGDVVTIDGGNTLIGGNDIIHGGGGDDIIHGDVQTAASGSTVTGGDDILDGGEGDDEISGNGGEDEINGGRGFDIAVYAGNSTSYFISDEGTHYTVKDTGGSSGDVDTLVNIEVLRFDNVDINIGNAEPELVIPDQTMPIGKTENLTDFIQLTDRENDPIQAVRLFDPLGYANWLYKGQAVSTGSIVEVEELEGITLDSGDGPDMQTLSVSVFDGINWSDTVGFTLTTTGSNTVPVADVPDQVIRLDQPLWYQLEDFLKVTTPNGGKITLYELRDTTGASNWTADGNIVDASNGYQTDKLSEILFSRDDAVSTQKLELRVYGGGEWSAWEEFTLETTEANIAPVITPIADQTIALDENQWRRLSDVMTVTDGNGDAITNYRIYDNEGGDNWWADGRIVDASSSYYTSNLSDIWFKRDDVESTQTLWVRVFDGIAWSNWDSFLLTSAAPNTAPVVSVEDQTIGLDEYEWVRLDTVLSVTDADGDAITHYEVWDDEGGNNWYADGATVDASTGYATTNLSGIWFERDTVESTQTLWVRAHDGTAWGAWDSFVLNTTDTASNTAPVVAVEDQTIGLNEYEWVRLDTVLSVTDADGDAITHYEVWDEEGGDNWWADGGTVDASMGYTTTNLAGIWFERDTVESTQTLWVRAHDGTEWGAWDSFLLSTV